MADARAIVELGRRVRVETKTKTRQPLAAAVIHVPGAHDGLLPLLPIVSEELNVKHLRFAESGVAFGRWRAKPNFRVLGPRLGTGVRDVAAALARDGGTIAGELARGARAAVAGVELGPDDVDLIQEVEPGWGIASDAGITVALDLELTQELVREGLARDLIRVVQDLRKAAGLEVTQRIELGVVAAPDLEAAIAAHRDEVMGETLAVALDARERDEARQEATIGGAAATVTLRRA
jgi:isoleucyl-tRNA synthetase